MKQQFQPTYKLQDFFDMNEQKNETAITNHIPSQVLDLMLDVVLEIMQAERGSLMLLDDETKELSIKSAKGIKDQIIREARVRLGNGVSGKVAVSGKSVFLKEMHAERRADIESEDLIKKDAGTSYVTPIKVCNETMGTININSIPSSNEILAEKAQLVEAVINRFSEYLAQAHFPKLYHETPSQLYMANLFQEYNTLRELRTLFDYIFYLITDIIGTKKKGVFILRNQESGFFDMVLGYGFESKRYKEIYNELVPNLKKPGFESTRDITIFNRKEFSLKPEIFKEEFFILLPLVAEDTISGQLLVLSDKVTELDKSKKKLVKSACEIAAKTINESAMGQKFKDLTFTDSLTGTYNYGLWWNRLHEEFSRARRLNGSKISLIIFDIDHFNQFNEDHGFFIGDQLLRVIADKIKSCVRPIDIVGRIGGEEFGVVLLGSSKKDCLKVAKRIIFDISNLPVEMRLELSHALTLSGGISNYPDDTDAPDKLVEKAKTALVSAKIMGGNRVNLFEQLEE
ncbi:GGDEF domain-containing protein [Candidatus Magnetomoraceae bacterium gMMP-15]